MRVLHVPYTYFPDSPGGTEVYVASLCAELGRRGIDCGVAAPSATGAIYCHEGVPVERFATMAAPGSAQAWGAADPEAAAGFDAILARARPNVVHLHARTSAVSPALADLARARRAKVVLTYHSPTMSCARGTMLYRGAQPCDGAVLRARCVSCALEGLGLPGVLAGLASSPMAGRASGLARGRLRLPWLIGESCDQFLGLLERVDHVVAVCEWVRDALLRNGVADERLTLCRQGVAGAAAPPEPRGPRRAGEPLQIAYYGRNDPTKGVDLLVEAVLAAPAADLALDLYPVEQDHAKTIAGLKARCASDRRISVRRALAPGQVSASMAGYDLIAVPSLGMETGPLVVLEAQAAGTPVLGTNRGGIAELVRDGVDGILLPPGDLQAWARTLAELAASPERIASLRANIAPPRMMAEVGDDMAALYRRLEAMA